MKQNTQNQKVIPWAQQGNFDKEVTSIAVLSAASSGDFGIAVCTLDIEIDENGISPRVQLMPDGKFAAQDGRPNDVATGSWLLDQEAFEMLKATAASRKNDFHFDYEHQTLKAEQNGKPAPASGWFKADALEYVPGKGLFALNVKWTDKAAAMLKADEYRFISPVFHYNKDTGRPVILRHFALTNDPALDGLDKVVALKNSQQPQNGVTPMNEALQLLQALGVSLGDGEEPTKAHFEQGVTAVKALQAKAKQADDANEQVAALKAESGNVDLSKYVPVEVANSYREQLAALKSQHDHLSVDQEIEKAKQDGRIIEAEVDYMKDLAKQQGLAALKQTLDARSPLAALTQQQSTPLPNERTGEAALTAEEKYAADQLGISHADYLKQKEGEN